MSDAMSEVMKVFEREQQLLAATPAPDGVIAVGATIPDAELLDVHGQATTVNAALGERSGVLVFYRGAWCPHCNRTLHDYEQDLLPALRDRGVALIAISPQTPDGSLTMQEKHDLSYGVLSDPGSVLMGELGIVTAPSPEVRAAQLELGLDIAAGTADASPAIPVPTVMIVDAERRVRWVDVRPDYSIRTSAEDIVAALDAADGLVSA